LSGAVWAYVYGHLAAKGIHIITVAELIDYPGSLPAQRLSIGKQVNPMPARVLKLLRDNFGPGDKIIEPNAGDEIMRPDPAVQIYAQGFITPRAYARYY
jgi:hypothetical protein